MYTVTSETVSKAIAVCRKALTKDTVEGVSFALEVLETVLGETRTESEQESALKVMAEHLPLFPIEQQQPPAQLPLNILDEWCNGAKEK